MELKKILITDSYPLNSGDVAIVISMIDQLRLKYRESSIVVESSHPKVFKLFLDEYDVKVIPRIFDIEKLFQDTFHSHEYYEEIDVLRKFQLLALGMYDSLTFLISALFMRFGINTEWCIRPSRRKQLQIIKEAHIVLSNGGSFLSSHYHYEHRLYFYAIALLIRKPLVLFAQTIGPFNSLFSRFGIPYVMNKADLVTVREPYSFAYVKPYAKSGNLSLTADIACLLELDETEKLPFEDGAYITICVKLPKTTQGREKYISSMQNVVSYAKQQNLAVCITSHTTVDDVFCNELYEYATHAYSKNKVAHYSFGIHPKALKHIYAHSHTLVSARMHAILLAISKGVPFVALSYEEKFSGMIEQLDLLQYKEKILFDIENVESEKLRDVLHDVYANYEMYSNAVQKGFSAMEVKSKENMTLLDTCVSRNK